MKSSLCDQMTNSIIVKVPRIFQVYVSVEDTDDEIIRHVQKHDSFAIWSHDTDFVITNVRCLMFHSGSFDQKTLKMTCYNRQRFAEKLGIKPEELPLYAILNGNDIISQDIVRVSYYCKFCNHYVEPIKTKLS